MICSPATPRTGTRLTWTKQKLLLPEWPNYQWKTTRTVTEKGIQHEPIMLSSTANCIHDAKITNSKLDLQESFEERHGFDGTCKQIQTIPLESNEPWNKEDTNSPKICTASKCKTFNDEHNKTRKLKRAKHKTRSQCKLTQSTGILQDQSQYINIPPLGKHCPGHQLIAWTSGKVLTLTSSPWQTIEATRAKQVLMVPSSSVTQTSALPESPSTGTKATRPIQSWIASVICGTTYHDHMPSEQLPEVTFVKHVI